MTYMDNLESLKYMMKYKEGQLRREFNDEYRFFPFTTNTRRSRFKLGFKTIIGETSRILNEKSWDNNLSNEKIIKNILDNDKIECNKEDKKYLNALLNSYLIKNDKELNIIHPHLYMYVTEINDNSRGNELQIGLFMNDVFLKNDEKFHDFFDFKDDDKTELYYKNNILIDLILENLNTLPDKTYDSKYISRLSYVTDVFKEDMAFVLEHEEFLTDNIEILFAYYYFFYLTQFSLKIYDKKADLDKIEKIYYLVEDETASINRKTIEEGYKLIKKENETLLSKVLVIDYVNKLLNKQGLIYKEILEELEKLSAEELLDFNEALRSFILLYCDIRNVPIDETKLNTDNYQILIDILFDSINEEYYLPARGRYALCLEDLGKTFFLKRRGRHGYVLNINQDLLLAITALSIKEDRIKLKDLFKEYERRGIFFDRLSKLKIEELLTKLNLIDKKSDSGDAQYVRRIL